MDLLQDLNPTQRQAVEYIDDPSEERIQMLVPPEAAHYLWMGTFHSIATRILRNEADKLGFTRDFSIYDSPDMKSVLKSICKDLQLDEIYEVSVINT